MFECILHIPLMGKVGKQLINVPHERYYIHALHLQFHESLFLLPEIQQLRYQETQVDRIFMYSPQTLVYNRSQLFHLQQHLYLPYY